MSYQVRDSRNLTKTMAYWLRLDLPWFDNHDLTGCDSTRTRSKTLQLFYSRQRAMRSTTETLLILVIPRQPVRKRFWGSRDPIFAGFAGLTREINKAVRKTHEFVRSSFRSTRNLSPFQIAHYIEMNTNFSPKWIAHNIEMKKIFWTAFSSLYRAGLYNKHPKSSILARKSQSRAVATTFWTNSGP